MRLMLGRNNQPELLVDVSENREPHNFKFLVVNSAWEGTYRNGTVTVHDAPAGDFDITGVDILCDNQDRLRGNYQTVVDNYSNEEYIAPEYKIPESWDSDIPF